MTLHDGGQHDVYALWKRFRADVSLVPMIEGTAPYATFGHIMGGYDSGYFGYIWSQVYSADMFVSKFKETGQIESGAAGLEYREKVLGPGGSKNGMELLKDFLGREPTADAFMKSLF